LFHGLIGYALLTSLGFQLPVPIDDEMKLIDVLPDPPPPPAEPDLPEIAKAERVAPRTRKGQPRRPISGTRRPRSSRRSLS
jgi:hypothetical protein